jgi:hypothetical protein
VTESDNDHFLIERSQKGIALDSLATVAGAGDSNSPLDYYLTDHHPFDGLSYYRLSQIDYDGTITYFPVISVHTNLPTALSIHPNPGNGNSFVIDNINVEPGLSVAIIDAQGREVYRSKVMPDHGEVSRSIDVTPSRPLNPGVYNVVITTHRNRYVEKLVVL